MIQRIISISAFIISLVVVLPSFAVSPVDFTGTWTLDLSASESVEAILEAQGRSWAERKIADHIVVTQTITQSANEMIVEVTSAVKDKREVIRLDGVEEVKESQEAGRVISRTYWDESGKKLVTENIMTTPDGDKVNMILTRFLEEGGKVMRQDIALKKADGTVLNAKRVLRSQGT